MVVNLLPFPHGNSLHLPVDLATTGPYSEGHDDKK